MKKITIIEPAAARQKTKKRRVAAYCRVSTGMDDQLVSLETQKAHYEEYITANPEWEYAGLYYEGCVIIPLTRKVLDFQGFAPIDSTFHSTIRQKVINETSRSMSSDLAPFRCRLTKCKRGRNYPITDESQLSGNLDRSRDCNN